MHFLRITLAGILLVLGCSVHSQVIKGSLIGGFNLAQVDGDEVYGFKRPGFNVGVGAIVPINDQWSYSIETNFDQKGSYERWAPEYNDTIDFYYKLRLNYVQIPMMVHYEDRQTITVGTGFSYGRLVTAKEWEYGQPTATNLSGPYSKNDFAWIVGLRFRLSGRLKFDFRYSYSIAPIRTRHYVTTAGQEWDRKQYNNVLTFRVIYVFNEKQSEEVRKTRQ